MLWPVTNIRTSAGVCGSALIVTLAVLVLVTLLVVSLASMVGLERATTRQSFENQRARELAGIAVDEAVATLRDNIPTTNQWAVGPGKLTYFTSQTTTSTVPLCSGQATGTTSSTGQVDLNAPIIGSSPTSYPIIAPNTEYKTAPAMPMGWVEVLQDGTLVRPGSASNTSAAKPVVGRYAYWVDTETSKANINTAGRAQSTYNFDGTKLVAGNRVDSQNLTGSPSRLDLSQLDGGITSAQSMATYHYTYGGYWLPDDSDSAGDYLKQTYFTKGGAVPGTAPVGPIFPPIPVYPQGMHRFNDISDWSQMTNDLIFGTAVTPVTAAQVQQNQFYLTTHSNTPELTPWGFNKLWMQPQGANPTPFLTPFSTYMGNRLNGKGVPFYPMSVAVAQTNSPGVGGQGENHRVPDSRYYVTPNFKETDPSSYFESMSDFVGYQASTPPSTTQPEMESAVFINNMMVQLNRTDWPGFPGLSFVGKYGQNECEDLAYNMLFLYDSSIGLGSLEPYFIGIGIPSRAGVAGVVDRRANYGSLSLFGVDYNGNDLAAGSTKIDGKASRLMEGVGEWPYFTQLSVSFTPVQGTGYNIDIGSKSQYAGKITETIITGTGTTTVNYWTKNNNRPAFAPDYSLVTPPVPYNVAMQPTVQIVYPSSFKNPFVFKNANPSQGRFASANFDMIDIAVTATGTYNGAAVTYGSPTESSATGHPYYWGLMEDNAIPAGNANQGSGMGPVNGPVGISGQQSCPIDAMTPGQISTLTFPTIYIGPFDATCKPSIQFHCRFVLNGPNAHTTYYPMEMAPLAYNSAPTVTLSNQDQLYKNIMNGYAPTFVFDPSTDPNYSTWNMASLQDLNVTYEVTDPRVSRYLSDWTMRSGSINPNPLMVSNPSYTGDPVSGVTGDSSKFTWPDVGFNYFTSGYGIFYYYTSPPPGASDLRATQTANNIEGFPGIGWLSVLPTNIESSQGNVAAGTGSGDPLKPGQPIPWRTLSLEPSTTGQIPDWLLLEAFALAYDQTFCSQTEGKINVNAAINPQFPKGTTIPARLKPLEAFIKPNTYPSSGNSDLAAISAATVATAIAAGPGSSNPSGSSLPSDIFMYPGQLCQLGLTSSGGNQWQRESLMRTVLSTLTTQSSDFKVHVVAQAVKQVKFTGDPTSDFVVTGEQRLSALISRATNLGPDNVPDSGWTSMSAAFNANTADENDTNATTATVASSTAASVTPTTGIGTTLKVGVPTFKYVISDLTYTDN